MDGVINELHLLKKTIDNTVRVVNGLQYRAQLYESIIRELCGQSPSGKLYTDGTVTWVNEDGNVVVEAHTGKHV